MDSDHFVVARPVGDISSGSKQAASRALTRREREIVGWALQGKENKEIAYDLRLADSTVRVLMSRAMGKLGVHSRKALLEIARRLFGGGGVGDPGEN
jgi:DNA-binding CsgD family transcriptional regulator